MTKPNLVSNEGLATKLSAILPMRAFAANAHAAQLYGNYPYTYHLDKGIEILCRHNIQDLDFYGAFYLHDYWEDVPNASEATVRSSQLFSERSIAISKAVTDPAAKNRAERKLRFYTQLIEFTKANQDLGAVLIKLVDRTANVEESVATHNEPMKALYRKESPSLLACVQTCIKLCPNDPLLPTIHNLLNHLSHLLNPTEQTLKNPISTI